MLEKEDAYKDEPLPPVIPENPTEMAKHVSKEEVVAVVRRAAQGDDQAFAQLYEWFHEPLLRYLKSFVPDEMLAEDLAQEVFIRVRQKMRRGQYEERGRFFQWLCQVGRNMYIDHYRRKKVRGIGPMPAWTEEDNRETIFATHDGQADLLLEREEEAQLIRRLIAQLPPEQRRVVEMKIYEGLTFREIAEKTGVNINTTLGRMRYALEKMRRALMQEEGYRNRQVRSRRKTSGSKR